MMVALFRNLFAKMSASIIARALDPIWTDRLLRPITLYLVLDTLSYLHLHRPSTQNSAILFLPKSRDLISVSVSRWAG